MRIQLTKITLAAGFVLAMALTLTSCGPSKAELAIISAPSIGEVSGLKDKLIWLQSNVQSGGNYVLELEIDSYEKNLECGGLLLSSSCGKLSYKGKSDITITLRGIGANRTIHSGFTVDSGVTLVLNDNITLKGRTKAGAFIEIKSGGTLVMNEGSTITGNTNNYNYPGTVHVCGAGVYVDDGATFIMKGGTISGNTIHPRPLTAEEIEQAKSAFAVGYSIGAGSKKAAKRAEEVYSKNIIHVGGAGVYVRGGKEYLPIGSFTRKLVPSGIFIKTGGTITGYSSDQKNGNVIRDIEGNVLNSFGHAVFFDTFDTPVNAPKNKEPKAIDTTIGPEITINFKNGIFSEGRNEEMKPQEAIAEPEEATAPSDVPAEAQQQEGE